MKEITTDNTKELKLRIKENLELYKNIADPSISFK